MHLCVFVKLFSPVFLVYLGFANIFNVGVSLRHFFNKLSYSLQISYHFLPLSILIVSTVLEFSKTSEIKMSFIGNILSVHTGKTLTITVTLQLFACIQSCITM